MIIGEGSESIVVETACNTDAFIRCTYRSRRGFVYEGSKVGISNSLATLIG